MSFKGRKHSEEAIQKMRKRIPWNKGKKGYQVAWNKGKHHSEKTLKKMSEKLKGKVAWNKGEPCSEEAKQKLRKANLGQVPWNKGKVGYYSKETIKGWKESHLGNKPSEETKRKMSKAQRGEMNHFFGKRHMDKTKQKISRGNSGKKRSEEVKQRTRESTLGRKNPFFGRRHTKETKQKLSKKVKELWNDPEYRKNMGGPRPSVKGEKNPKWNSDRKQRFAPYTELFRDFEYRALLYERQNGICLRCKKELSLRKVLHHVNSDKQLDHPFNLAWMCKTCHHRLKRSDEKRILSELVKLNSNAAIKYWTDMYTTEPTKTGIPRTIRLPRKIANK